MIMKSKIQFLLVLLVVSIFFMVGCGGYRSAIKPGTQYSVEGKIDNLFVRDLLYKKKIITVTSIGFINGQGISIIGLQPGISEGKKVKILAEFFENINGTDVFRALQITSLTERKKPEFKKAVEPVSIPKPKKEKEPAKELPKKEEKPAAGVDKSDDTSEIKETIIPGVVE